jgi:hypothetical protein
MFVQFTIPRETPELEQLIDTCVARCVERWGGCTVTDASGYWQRPTDTDGITRGVWAEPVAILGVECESVIDTPSIDGFNRKRRITQRWFDNLAVYVRREGNQHTVYYRMFDGGEARFVGPDTILLHDRCIGCGKSTAGMDDDRCHTCRALGKTLVERYPR